MNFASTVETFLQLLSSGLIIGANYGLMCLGLGLIFGVMRVINFAQGDLMVLGMYFAFIFVGWVASDQTTTFLWTMVAVGLAGGLFYVFGNVLHRVLISRVTGMRVAALEDAGHSPQLILTLGLSLVIQNAALMLFGSTPSSIPTPLSSKAWKFGPLWGDQVYLFINQARTWSAILAVVAAAILANFLRHTSLGRQMRAAANNPVASTYVGVDVNRSHRIAFGLGVAITTIAGVMMATYQPFQPYTGQDFIVIMYAGVVLGGMGSVGGTFWGGLIIGLVQQLSTLVMPMQLQSTVIFAVFLAILLFMPQGLFGRNVERV
jgi:branched-chain amino acid transport system permease protein